MSDEVYELEDLTGNVFPIMDKTAREDIEAINTNFATNVNALITADTTHVKSTELTTKINDYFTEERNNRFKKLTVEYEDGIFNGLGQDVTATNSFRIKDSLATKDGEMLFIYIKKGYTLIVNDINPNSNVQENFLLYNHCSYTTDGRSIRLGARLNGKSEITDDYADILQVYKLDMNKTHGDYDIVIASSTSEPYFKERADVVCDGTNDQFIIQCAIYNVMKNNKVLLYTGDYYITEVRDNPASADGLFGKKVVFNIQNPFVDYKKCIHVEGYNRSIVQAEVSYATTIRFADECWENIKENGEQISVIGGEYRNFYGNRVVMQIENINFRGNDALKPVTYIDGYYCGNMMIGKCNVMNGNNTFGAFTYIPSKQNIGFRGLQGSPYGSNYIKNCLAWHCGVGYAISGEHFVLDDTVSAFCNYGFTFGDYNGRIKCQHNIIMIKPVVSQCMHSFLFNRYGINEDVDESTLDSDTLSKLESTQDIECYGLQFGERTYTTSGLTDEGFEDGSHKTDGFYEVHDRYSWKGIVTTQGYTQTMKGCRGIKITNLDLKVAGSLDDRPDASNAVPDYSKYYDIDNNKDYIAIGGVWKALN